MPTLNVNCIRAILYFIFDFVAKVLEIIRAIGAAMYDAVASTGRAILGCGAVMVAIVYDIGKVVYAVFTQVWPSCSSDNIILLCSIFLIVTVLPGFGLAMQKFLEIMLLS